jgi:hypothetical protein
MQETTIADRKYELRQLLEQIEAHPERDWTEARKRIAVLKEMVARHEGANG